MALRAFATAACLAVSPACGTDTCDGISAPDSVQVTKGKDAQITFSVETKKLPTSTSVLEVHGFGKAQGLRFSYTHKPDAMSVCESTPASADSHCGLVIDLMPGGSYRVGLRGNTPGSYDIEARLFDDPSAETLANDPVCATSSRVEVR